MELIGESGEVLGAMRETSEGSGIWTIQIESKSEEGYDKFKIKTYAANFTVKFYGKVSDYNDDLMQDSDIYFNLMWEKDATGTVTVNFNSMAISMVAD